MVMKKLIAISVVFALVAGTAFAEINVGANAASGVILAKSNGEKGDDEIKAAVGRHTARITASGQNDEGTFGGQVFVFAELGEEYYNQWWWGNDAFAFVWWKPIDLVKLQLGHNPWGDIDCKQIVDWGFHASDAPDVGMHNPYGTGDNSLGQDTGFYGGFGAFGSLLSLYPVEGLAINFAVPFFDGVGREVYKKFHAQLTYDISGIGKAAISYTHDDNVLDITNKIFTHSNLYASFFLTAIDNMELNIGLAFPFPVSETTGEGDFEIKTTWSEPLAVGLGFSFNATDALNIKARLATTFAGNATTVPKKGDTVKVNAPFQLGFNILPSYNLDIVKIFFKAGIMYTGESEDINNEGKVEKVKDSSAFGWHINPYVTKSMGAGTFYAGLVIESDGIKGSAKDSDNKDKSAVKWSIPLAIVFGF